MPIMFSLPQEINMVNLWVVERKIEGSDGATCNHLAELLKILSSKRAHLINLLGC